MPRLRFDSEKATRTAHPYQETCQEDILANLRKDHRPCLLHLPMGGGKTFVANNVVARFLKEHQGYAMWITKDWWLLEQAALDMAARHRGMAGRLRRMGGDGKLPCLQQVRRKITKRGVISKIRRGVLYSTLQTFKRRLEAGRLPRRLPSIIVWDECHWGYAGETGKALRRWAGANKVPLLGLTATPRAGGEFQPACRHTYQELVDEGYLADYKLETRETGTRWRPRWARKDGDFTGPSLAQLAENKRRNRRIVKEYVANAGQYGKTVIFACNIRHANKLAKMLNKKKIAARPVHSGNRPQQNNDALSGFSANPPKVTVLVNVAMMTHGVDVPDIKTVFLCRPTRSDILYAQMVGRGTRRTPEKARFYLVEFTDNRDNLEHVIQALEFFGAPGAGGGAAARRNRDWPHEFDPTGAPTWTGEDVPDEVKNLWYREGQTFGVEFELTSDEDPRRISDEEWQIKADGLLESLRRKLGPGKVRDGAVKKYHTEGYESWKVEYDSSAGWEVVSPILRGEQGLVELDAVCRTLTKAARKLDLRVNHRTGTHVHLGWLADPAYAAQSILWTRLLEPVLRSLVPPSRLAAYDADNDFYDPDTPNEYCRPVADAYNLEELHDHTTLDDLQDMSDDPDDPDDLRHATLNLTPLFEGKSHVEVRLLGGTTEARKLLPWISLWMRILWVASRREPPKSLLDDPEAAFPALRLDKVFRRRFIGVPGEGPDFQERLESRQREVFDLWRDHSELTPWLPEYLQDRRRWKPKIAPTLRSRNLARPNQLERSNRNFINLDNNAKRCAVWCTLVGEDPLVRRDRDTVARVAERLRSEGWADFSRLVPGGRLYRAIEWVLERATRRGDGWLDIPRNTYVRAYYQVEDMDTDIWCRLVIDALTDLVEEDFDEDDGEDGWVQEDRLIQKTFRLAMDRYGLRRNGRKVTWCTKRRTRNRIRNKIRKGIRHGVANRHIESSDNGYRCHRDRRP